MTVEDELAEATERILQSNAQKKLVVAGPGTGKTYLFQRILERNGGKASKRLAITFVRNLRNDLATKLGESANVRTLHEHALSELKRHPEFARDLSRGFRLFPGLRSLLKSDWRIIVGERPPEFVRSMRDLTLGDDERSFYYRQSSYYDAVDFDDAVYRLYESWEEEPGGVTDLDLLLVDEFQDFNKLETAVVMQLAKSAPTVIVGDDDQALYSQLRQASWDGIRSLYEADEFEVFELPFCMRCTKVIVDAVADVLQSAHERNLLTGRIDKPYRYYEPKKGTASARYPKIGLVECSTQTRRANYFGQFIYQEIEKIPSEEIDEARSDGDTPVLIVGFNHVTELIADYLKEKGIAVERASSSTNGFTYEDGLRLLQVDPRSNLGWRLVLEVSGDDELRGGAVRKLYAERLPLIDLLPEEFREKVLTEAEALEEEESNEEEAEPAPLVKIVTFPGAKGLSAQHVFLVGAHNYLIPRRPNQVQDLEICEFLVGLTRAKQKCWIVVAGRLAGRRAAPSEFISWIARDKYDRIRVNKNYWRN